MKQIVLSVVSLALISCASPSKVGRSGSATPELSLVHLQGKITQMPAKSKWPASIKVGTAFDYWAVIDNRVSDGSSSSNQGSYQQNAWPSRYDLKVGDLRFSSDGLNPPTFGVTIYDELPGNSDGYVIAQMYHTNYPELSDLKTVHFIVSLRPQRSDLITSDKLPLHSISPSLLTGNSGLPHFRGLANAKADGSDQTFGAQADKFEVFQATADSPLRLPSP